MDRQYVFVYLLFPSELSFDGFLLQILPLLQEIVIDQIPNLGDLKTFLTALQVQTPPNTANNSVPSSFLIQQIPEIRERLLKGNFTEILKYQREHIFPQLIASEDDEQISAYVPHRRWSHLEGGVGRNMN